MHTWIYEYHVGVNSYSIEIGKFESESEKLMFKRLNKKGVKFEFIKMCRGESTCVGV